MMGEAVRFVWLRIRGDIGARDDLSLRVIINLTLDMVSRG
jgi:hypothetical protein